MAKGEFLLGCCPGRATNTRDPGCCEEGSKYKLILLVVFSDIRILVLTLTLAGLEMHHQQATLSFP